MIKNNSVPARCEDVVEKILDDEIILYHKKDHSAHSLNQTAGILWSLCDGSMSIADMVDYLVHHFNADRKVIEQDVFKILQELKQKDLIALK